MASEHSPDKTEMRVQFPTPPPSFEIRGIEVLYEPRVNKNGKLQPYTWVPVHAGYVLADGCLHYEVDAQGEVIGIAKSENWRLR